MACHRPAAAAEWTGVQRASAAAAGLVMQTTMPCSRCSSTGAIAGSITCDAEVLLLLDTYRVRLAAHNCNQTMGLDLDAHLHTKGCFACLPELCFYICSSRQCTSHAIPEAYQAAMVLMTKQRCSACKSLKQHGKPASPVQYMLTFARGSNTRRKVTRLA